MRWIKRKWKLSTKFLPSSHVRKRVDLTFLQLPCCCKMLLKAEFSQITETYFVDDFGFACCVPHEISLFIHHREPVLIYSDNLSQRFLHHNFPSSLSLRLSLQGYHVHLQGTSTRHVCRPWSSRHDQGKKPVLLWQGIQTTTPFNSGHFKFLTSKNLKSRWDTDPKSDCESDFVLLQFRRRC